ncbi:hypothetical protein [Vibrio rotiferianus]|uniref:hypothetical protein n=1 Tax=Vibrio rotiferianus TaxID=190895 RepID=UPI00397FECC7
MNSRVNPWLEKSIQNILPLSNSTEFKSACQEWTFTGEVVDYGEQREQCELCEHDELRYHFNIINKTNSNNLWVGSSCILRFEEIIVLDENNQHLLDRKERKKVLDAALKAKQLELCLEPIRQLWRCESSQRYRIEYIAIGIKEGRAPQADDLTYLFRLLKNNGIEFRPEIYSVNLRSEVSQYKLLSMKKEDQQIVWLCMSPTQKTKFRERLGL